MLRKVLDQEAVILCWHGSLLGFLWASGPLAIFALHVDTWMKNCKPFSAILRTNPISRFPDKYVSLFSCCYTWNKVDEYFLTALYQHFSSAASRAHLYGYTAIHSYSLNHKDQCNLKTIIPSVRKSRMAKYITLNFAVFGFIHIFLANILYHDNIC